MFTVVNLVVVIVVAFTFVPSRSFVPVTASRFLLADRRSDAVAGLRSTDDV